MIHFKTLSKIALTGILATSLTASYAQREKPDSALLKIYRATPARINDVIHTKLDVRFDYKKRYMYGKEWATFKPHFYPTDSLRLDAKGMDIKNISVVKNGRNVPLKYKYEDSLSLNIQLDKVYHNNESYVIYIDYTSKPNELKVKGSAAINDAKGLYFINPDGTEKDKPVQIWTQGETEGSSAWFPTIDKPEQKTTDEISMTVQSKYVTLSNGKLVSQKKNADGTRTDTWKMDLPHSTYLFMMAVGDFKIYRDHWRNKEVNYYMEPKYAPYAKDIFGLTPEMIEFYSKLTGVDYPWNKYSQIVVRDYVSGAMENTTATLHGEFENQTKRQLLDSYYDFGMSTIAHELFHQWFGDYVTCESWSNLTVNESFANFSEVLWAEHKYGQDVADDQNHQDMAQYLGDPAAAEKDLVRFHYVDKEDVFDDVTYQKGGRILNMLRNYLGKDAFYKGLNIYLKTNAFKNGEAQQLRLALEQASGRDLNWFFNQWYYGAGHPVFDISYKWDDASKTETVYVQQKQDGQIFNVPLAVDIYAGGKKERHKVWVNGKSDTLTFRVASKPDLVNFDGDKIILCKKTDNKSLDEFAFQYFNAPLYMDRFEAIEAAQSKEAEAAGQKIILAALKDKYYGLRLKAVRALKMNNKEIHDAALPVLTTLAKSDANTLVRAAALTALGKLKDPAYMNIYKEAIGSQSYAVQGAALTAINGIDSLQALTLAKGFEKDNLGALTQAMITVFATNGSSEAWPFVYDKFTAGDVNTKFGMIRNFGAMTGKVKNPEFAQQGISEIKALGIKYKKFGGVGPFIINMLNNIKEDRTKLNDAASAKAADDAATEVKDAK
ncbi:M1 family metallopeptidase [Mucilaginibacter sp.]|jgi:aminopeptidase N|uniref:M1 family metallopeptidase n=1 Tax=Mucilaginibacter sp. TaxID=1882438 RepID=UPI002B532297|nr:M1 family metallopeptidase [Mucilaginibacter sp.]HTI59107.1 M1 family metallopeptidase [Mucilaginibacter sp.]